MINDKKSLLGRLALTFILVGAGIVTIIPIIWMISASFKYEAEVFSVPIKWIPDYLFLGNYIFAFEKFPYLDWYLNTIKVTVMVVLFNVVFSSMAGYAFAKLKFVGNNLIFFIFIATLMIPLEVRIIPQFVMFRHFDMINYHSSVYLPWIFNAFAIFLMRQFFVTVPDELIEAARIDGCSEYRTFLQVVMPLAKSSIMALVILSFTWGWNSYLAPLVYINDMKKQLLAVGIDLFKTQYVENYGPQMAGATLALLPVIVVYLIAQKSFIEGIALSGIKG